MDALSLAAGVASPTVLLAGVALLRRRGYALPLRVAVPASLLVGVAVWVALGGDQIRGLQGGVLLGFATGVGIVHYLDAPRGRWSRWLRSRLLLGVPWGTLVSVLFVLAVYLFLQGGATDLGNPVALPFTSWSYYYPLGVLTAPFAHGSLGHVTGNLVGTLVLAPVAEIAWSHFPTERGRSSFGSWRTNPYVRAFGLFPLGVLLVGLATSVFAWGAIIGFSGVVFAFAGFAAVRYPILTVVALAARGAVGTLYYSLRDPVVVASAQPSFGPPWWVGIAVQGHLLGLLLGATLGILLVARRRQRPSAGRLFVGLVVMGFSLALYAVWWFRDPTTYVLYRGLGVLLVVTFALLLTIGVRARPVEVVEGVTRRQLAVALVVLPLVTMAMVAVPLNTTTLDETTAPADAIEVRDYTVYYAEDVSNERVGAIGIDLLNETTEIRASGVIVVSEDRHLWTEAVGAAELGFWGQRTVRVGGVGWSESIRVKRDGWTIVGSGPVYNVFMRPPGGDFSPVFASPNRTAGVTIADRNVTVTPGEGTFTLDVTRENTTLGTTTIPTNGNTTTAGGLTFERRNQTVYVLRNGTRVRILQKETYN